MLSVKHEVTKQSNVVTVQQLLVQLLPVEIYCKWSYVPASPQLSQLTFVQVLTSSEQPLEGAMAQSITPQ